MNDGAELRLSKSSLDLWNDCNYAWMLAYVYRMKAPPTLHMLAGRAVHAGIEAYWKGEDALEATQRLWDADLASIPSVDPFAATESLADARGLVRTYLDKVAPTFTPKLVEAKFAIRVNGVLVTGAIDAADDDVHDTKTTSTPSKVDPKRHEVEMTLYAWGARSLTGQMPRRLILDVIGRNGRYTQKPVNLDERGAAETIGYVADRINAGSFEPTGARTGECHYCPYSTGACRYAVL